MSPREQKYSITENKALLWAEPHPSVLTYLSKINACKSRAAQDIYLFCEWCEKTPEELLALKNGFESLDAEQLLDKFVYSKVAFPDTRKWQIIQKIRAFFRVNYRPLASSAGKMEYPPAKGSTLLTKQKRKVFFDSAYNPRDKALVMASFCTSMALETLSKLRWYHFEEDWQSQELPHISIPSDLLKGHGKGKYRGIRQECFLTPEAKRQLIEYREWFSKTFKHKWTNDDYVFLEVKGDIGQPLAYLMIAKVMVKLSERSGVKFNVHAGRSIVQTALESVSCPNNWIKKVKGRKCTGEELPYSKPNIEQLRTKYKEALGELEFLSEADSITRAKVEELSAKAKQKDVVIEALITNGNRKDDDIQSLQIQFAELQAQFEGFIKSGYLIKEGDKATFVAPGYTLKGKGVKASLSEEQTKELLKTRARKKTVPRRQPHIKQ
jgi:hypothetical protein